VCCEDEDEDDGFDAICLAVLDPAAQALQANLMAIEDEERRIMNERQWMFDIAGLTVCNPLLRCHVLCPCVVCICSHLAHRLCVLLSASDPLGAQWVR
jgi:hypothetical protein